MSQRGQMIPKGENKWLLRIYLGRDETGKRQYSSKQIDGTTSQARQELTKMLRDKDTDAFVRPTKTTVKTWVSEWLDGKANVAAKTLADYKLRMSQDVYPHIGGAKLTDLTPAHIRSLYGKLAAKGLSARTIRYTHTVLSQALSIAVEDKVMTSNPCAKKSVRECLPVQGKVNLQVLTAEQMQALLQSTEGTTRGMMWRLLLVSGVRPQEALALTWEDVTETGILIRRALHNDGKGKYTSTEDTKTEGSNRSLVIDQDTLAALQKHKARQSAVILKMGKKYNRQGLVFATRYGTHFHISNVRRWWKDDLEACDLPRLKLYVARHTHLSHYLALTGNAKATADRAGHKNPNITLNTYIHTLPGTDAAGADAFGKLLLRVAK